MELWFTLSWWGFLWIPVGKMILVQEKVVNVRSVFSSCSFMYCKWWTRGSNGNNQWQRVRYFLFYLIIISLSIQLFNRYISYWNSIVFFLFTFRFSSFFSLQIPRSEFHGYSVFYFTLCEEWRRLWENYSESIRYIINTALHWNIQTDTESKNLSFQPPDCSSTRSRRSIPNISSLPTWTLHSTTLSILDSDSDLPPSSVPPSLPFTSHFSIPSSFCLSLPSYSLLISLTSSTVVASFALLICAHKSFR